MSNTKHPSIIIVSLLLLVLLPNVNAASPVNYTCCKVFVTSNGTAIEGYNNAAEWTVNDAANSVVDDTKNTTEGGHSVMLKIGSGGAATNGYMTKGTLNTVISNPHNINTWVYVDDASNLKYVRVLISKDAGITQYFDWVNNTIMRTGWNHLVANESDFNANGGVTWADTITLMRWEVAQVVAGTINVSFDDTRYNIQGKPKAIITFDDGDKTVFSNAYPVMAANSQRGVSFVIPNLVGSSSHYMTTSDLNTLFSAGWDISSHTYNHTDLNSTTVNNVTAELNNSYGYLYSNGYKRSASFFAYPFGNGSRNDTVVQLVKDRYVIARGTEFTNSFNQLDWIGQSGDINASYRLYIRDVGKTVLTSTVKNDINRTISLNATYILLFHNITTTTGDAKQGTDYTLENFTDISNYLALRSSDIDVVTFYDYVNISVPNNTPIIGKTVNVNVNGLANITVNNYLNDETINMTVFPSSDSVNVTVSTWNTNGDYYKAWSEGSTVPGITTTNVVGDLPANYPVKIKVDGTVKATGTTNSTGYIAFVYASGFSSHNFEIDLSTQEEIALQNGWCNSGNSGLNGTFLFGTILAFVVGGALLFVGLNNFDIKFVIGGIAVIVGIIVTMLVGNMISARMVICG